MRRAWPQQRFEIAEGLRLPMTEATLAFNCAVDEYIKVTTNKPRLASLQEWRLRVMEDNDAF